MMINYKLYRKIRSYNVPKKIFIFKKKPSHAMRGLFR